MTKEWRTYEEVATFLLDQVAGEFGLSCVEGKQQVGGLRSGTKWEIDAKGVALNGSTLVVEFRRHPTRALSQETMAALAYRIKDIGGTGGIIVSPLGLQKGAKVLAQAEHIHEVKLNENCTTTDYILQFVNQVRLGFSDQVPPLRDKLTINVLDKNGKVVDRRMSE